MSKSESISNWQLAVSFAGKDRDYVVSIVNEIKKALPQENIFYDFDYSEELSGKELFEYLRDIYANKSKYVMCFFSKNYAQSYWAAVETSAIKDRLFLNFMDSSFLIPIVMDGESNFLPATIGYWAKDTFSVEEIAKMTIHKIKTGESINLIYPNIIDTNDLAFKLKASISTQLTTYNNDYCFDLTDNGYCFTIKKSDCSMKLWIDYKLCGLRMLLIRCSYTECPLKTIKEHRQFSLLSCNAFVTCEDGVFTIHNLDFFSTGYDKISGNEAANIITKRIIDKINEGCKCLY